MANRIVIDPITRIEGHLRIEAEVKDGKIVDAYSSGTMVRGFEMILKGRDPRDAWAFTERACGVCTTVHALASVRTVEDALGITVPPNAELIRNLMFCAQYLQDHVVHFYHLHALDWVDVVSALKADPKKTSELAQSISNWPKSSPGYFSDLQKRLTAFVESGQLGIFANGYWGHPAYKLPAGGEPDRRRPLPRGARVAEGDRQGPHDLRRQEPASELPRRRRARARSTSTRPTRSTPSGSPTSARCSTRRSEFVEQVYLPDLMAVASFYKDWGAIGGGLPNYLAYGDLPDATATRDAVEVQVPARRHPQPQPGRGPPGRRQGPEAGRRSTSPTPGTSTRTATAPACTRGTARRSCNYTGPKPPYEQLDVEQKYSWLKTPRWKDHAMEVGPLARLLVAYASGRAEVKEVVDGALKQLDVPVGGALLDARPHGGARPRDAS